MHYSVEKNVGDVSLNIIATNIRILLSQLFDCVDKLPAATKKMLFSYQHYINSAVSALGNKDDIDYNYISDLIDKLVSSSSDLYQIHLDNELPKIAHENIQKIYSLTHELIAELNSYMKSFEEDKQNVKMVNLYEIGNDIKSDFDRKLEALTLNLKVIEREVSTGSEQTNKITRQIRALQSEVVNFDKNLNEFINAKKKEFDDHLSYLNTKKTEVDELVGTLSGTAIYGSYNDCAKNEKFWADRTRFISFLLMIAVVSVIGFTLYESSNQDFDLKIVMFRFVFSIALSVPAAYAARESAKHRNQQYQYQRLAMDLKSIDPYLSSLPSDLQHKLKVEMASKMFCPSVNEASEVDSYPINIQEIIMAIVGKINNVSTGSSAVTDKER